MKNWVFPILSALCASATRLRTAADKTNATKASAEVLELQREFNSVYTALKADCKAPGVGDALNAMRSLKGGSVSTGTKGEQCPVLCKGDDHCTSVCNDVRGMICDANFAPGAVYVAGDSASAAAAAATAATNAVREAIKDAVGQAAKSAQEAAKVAQAAVKQATEQSSKIAQDAAKESAKSAAEAAAKAASKEASIGAHAVASTAAAAAMSATVGMAKAPGKAAAPAPGGPGPAPAPAGF